MTSTGPAIQISTLVSLTRKTGWFQLPIVRTTLWQLTAETGFIHYFSTFCGNTHSGIFVHCIIKSKHGSQNLSEYLELLHSEQGLSCQRHSYDTSWPSLSMGVPFLELPWIPNSTDIQTKLGHTWATPPKKNPTGRGVFSAFWPTECLFGAKNRWNMFPGEICCYAF